MYIGNLNNSRSFFNPLSYFLLHEICIRWKFSRWNCIAYLINMLRQLNYVHSGAKTMINAKQDLRRVAPTLSTPIASRPLQFSKCAMWEISNIIWFWIPIPTMHLDPLTKVSMNTDLNDRMIVIYRYCLRYCLTFKTCKSTALRKKLRISSVELSN